MSIDGTINYNVLVDPTSGYTPFSSSNRMKTESSANIAYSEYQANLAVDGTLDSDWIDMGNTDKVQFSGYASASGMSLVMHSRTDPLQTALITTTKYNEGQFFLFNIVCRQRYMKFVWTNTTGGEVTNVSMEVKQTFGGSDKLSVFPVSVVPSDFSQAALVQAILRGKDVNDVYRNVKVNTEGALVVASRIIAWKNN